jgi:ABC-type sugar transport system ATPase subunit
VTTSIQPGTDVSERRTILRAAGIGKYFGSVVALHDINLDVYDDEVVGLVGDNGAGKSTLIKILSGNFRPDVGTIQLEGREIRLGSPADARALGIETVYQDLALCENLDSVYNFFIGREIYRRVFGFRLLQHKEMERRTRETLSRFGTHIPSMRDRVEYLSGGERQSVALGRFIRWGDKLVLLDEPTAALGVRETRNALDLIAWTRREKHVSMIFISHNIEHVFHLADRIVVLRNGEVAGVRETRATTPVEIVGLMTGSLLASPERAAVMQEGGGPRLDATD